MKTLTKTRLQIKDQNELINQISGTYKDFYRAAMEYIDNSIDAASKIEAEGRKISPKIEIEIDLEKKRVVFTDNCEGMSPEELCDLLSSVGQSKKKAVSWANGQFGFGVHAFRAFAKEATFVSRKKGFPEATIRIDRTIDESIDVPCHETNGKELATPGTRVTIGRFDAHAFKKATFVKSLALEIEHHFDDVLRAQKVKILISEPGRKPIECKYFDYSSLHGPEIKRKVKITDGKTEGVIEFDLKVLEKAQEDRLPVLTNKHRRIQTVSDLKSFKNHLRAHGDVAYIWANPFVVGSIEINNYCSPNITRDDLKDSKQREVLYEAIREVQKELKELIDETMNKKTQESFKKIGKIMSDCLSQILRKFKLEFEQLAPAAGSGLLDEEFDGNDGAVPFGGDDEAGGGGEGGNRKSSGGPITDKGSHGPGDNDKGGSPADKKTSSKVGKAGEQVITSTGPHIEFQNHAGEDRIIDLGNSLIVNTQHPDFISRNPNKSGRIKFDTRLLNYVSQVVSPYCVHRLFERSGKFPSVSEVGANVVNLTLKLESELTTVMLGEEMEIGLKGES